MNNNSWLHMMATDNTQAHQTFPVYSQGPDLLSALTESGSLNLNGFVWESPPDLTTFDNFQLSLPVSDVPMNNHINLVSNINGNVESGITSNPNTSAVLPAVPLIDHSLQSSTSL